MGGCGSREKEIKEKIGFSQNDYDYAIKRFSKMTQQKPGKTDQYFSFEGFKTYFTENPVFAQKLYIFMRNYGGQNYVDLNTFLTVVDLFTRSSMKLQSQLKNLDIYILFILVSLSNSEIMHKETFNFNNIYKISISYSNGVKLFKELINMQSDKGDILCHDDDQAPILLVNNIFEDHSILNYKIFNDKIKQETPQISKIVKNYIAGKFINKTLKNKLPKMESSELMNKQLIGMIFQQILIKLFLIQVFLGSINVQLLIKYTNMNLKVDNLIISIFLETVSYKQKDLMLYYLDIIKKIKIQIKQRNTLLVIFHLLNGKFHLIYQGIRVLLYFLFIQNLKYSQLMTNNKVNLLYQYPSQLKNRVKLFIVNLNKDQNNQVQELVVVDMIITEFGQMESNCKQVDQWMMIRPFRVDQQYQIIFIY
ncbi:unnamed protein product [Paramecium primaurelia]|uniref:Uncharacterized protein n=1 Tax=Paramecium primaurelia TaxID=5886 RepID=A0A8S1MM52_PARPR|nr:unnamed protein product [Paramecium primaurelia]